MEEKVFIPSTKSYPVLTNDPGKLLYYSNASGRLYVMQEGTLYEVDLEKNTRTTLVTNLETGQYVSSSDGHLLAYQKDGQINSATQIEVLNLSTGKGYQVNAGEQMRVSGRLDLSGMISCLEQREAEIPARLRPVRQSFQCTAWKSATRIMRPSKIIRSTISYILDVVFENDMAALKRAVKKRRILHLYK